jgi:hypothetical protein
MKKSGNPFSILLQLFPPSVLLKRPLGNTMSPSSPPVAAYMIELFSGSTAIPLIKVEKGPT